MGHARDTMRISIMGRSRTATLIAALLLAVAACVSTPGDTTPDVNERWVELQEHVPYPFARPLPPTQATPLDGTYVKVETGGQVHWPCRRCPDFKPEDGLWKIRFNRGVFHIYFPTGDWASTSSYAVAGDRLELFNDPSCIDEIGTYRWRMEDAGQLVLEVEDDSCAIEQRAWNLTSIPWQPCSAGWGRPRPEGCD